jgi:hypothetical protein
MPCLCPLCTDTPAYTWTPEWRLICEARGICRLPKIEERQERMARIEKIRGKAAREELEEAVKKEWNRREEWMEVK